MITTHFSEEFRTLIQEAVCYAMEKHMHKQAEIKFPSKDFYSVDEAAKLLNMAVTTLRKKYRSNIIQYVQEGRKITFKQSFLDDYIDRYTQPTKNKKIN